MMDLLTTELFPIDDNGQLFISPVITDWAPVHQQGIEVIIDLEGTLDQGVSTRPGHILYIYHHIYDEELPNLDRMHAVAELDLPVLAAQHVVRVAAARVPEVVHLEPLHRALALVHLDHQRRVRHHRRALQGERLARPPVARADDLVEGRKRLS